ncbi:hypothetical protein F4804DRAFT_61901 [Jackrogersella minutella]|nr:hypothetical protein F4804DRAFT_61901 [Jackrogersella minutella]
MAVHDYPYRKAVNVPVWMLQFSVLTILLVAMSWILWRIDSEDYESNKRKFNGRFFVAIAFQLGVVAMNILMNIIEIILIARTRMPPALFLSSACIKTATWASFFIFNVIATSVLPAIVTLFLFMLSIIQMVHGAIIVHGKRIGILTGVSKYSPADNPADLMDGRALGARESSIYLPELDTKGRTSPFSVEFGNKTFAFSPGAQNTAYEPDGHRDM